MSNKVIVAGSALSCSVSAESQLKEKSKYEVLGGSFAAEKEPESVLFAKESTVTLRQKVMSGSEPLKRFALTVKVPKPANAIGRVPLILVKVILKSSILDKLAYEAESVPLRKSTKIRLQNKTQ